MVTRAGLRPVGRSSPKRPSGWRADDLRPIPVFGSDELARLTECIQFNAAGAGRVGNGRQGWLPTPDMNCVPPLTSLRTETSNSDDLDGPGAPRLPKQEMVDLRADVLAQIENCPTR